MKAPDSTLRPPATNAHKKRDKLGDKLGNKMGDKTSGRRTHHPTRRRTPKKALTTPNNKLFAEKYKIRPPATKRNKKRDRLGDKTEDDQAGRQTGR